MENDPLNSQDEDDDEFQPQMNYCCGIKGDPVVSRKFRDARTRCGFVSLVFVLKLMQMAVVAFCLYYMIADEDLYGLLLRYNSLKPFNIPFVTSQQLQPYNWCMFLAFILLIFNFSCARCMNMGRSFPMNCIFLILNTFCICVICSDLVTVSWVQPYRYMIFLIVTTIGFLCLGICVLTALFDVEAIERGIYAGLFVYFLILFGFAHFVYVSSLGTGSTYHIEYDQFLKNVSVGGGIGLFINMVQLWYVQEMICGRVLSLHENEFIYVSLLV
ncbi:unnamed protein product [Orchesella dallaii]|uniref:Uncharacterized protein n=1 Tax=Orchesella dallaii TaxID=48710 RepID=A0ABP1QNG0_9HEXA